MRSPAVLKKKKKEEEKEEKKTWSTAQSPLKIWPSSDTLGILLAPHMVDVMWSLP